MSSVTITRGLSCLCLLLLHFRYCQSSSSAAAEDKSCVNSIQRLTTCLYYVTGHNSNPTPDCCDAVSDMRERNPLCLCKFIDVVRDGGPEVRNLGIEASKLDDLPSACHMKNTSTSACPKLLGHSHTTTNTSETAAAAGAADTPHAGGAVSSTKPSGGDVSKAVALYIEVVVTAVIAVSTALLSVN